MQAVSARWDAAVRYGVGAALVRSKAEIYDYTGTLLASTEQKVGVYPSLLLDEGGIDVDGSASVRRSGRVTFADPEGKFAPDSGSALMANESGNEIKLWAGFQYPDGATELLPQGVFGFQDDDTEAPSGDQTISLTIFDRSRRVTRAAFTQTYTIPKNTNYVDAISGLLRSRWVGIQIVAQPTLYLTPRIIYDPQDDPWARALEMAAAIGYDLYFDVNGVCQLHQILPASSMSPTVWDYSEGPNATVLGLSRRASNERGYNGVILTGASSSNGIPPLGVAWDTDPASPTYSGYDPVTKSFGPSPYGAFPTFESSSLLTTSLQCQAAAQARLLSLVGRHEIIEFQAIPNPAHEVRDLVKQKRARAKIDAVYELQGFNVPLRAGDAMRALTKERKVG